MNPPQHPDAIERAYAQAVREADAHRHRAECAEEALKLLEVMHTVNNQAHWGTLFMVDVEAIMNKLRGETK